MVCNRCITAVESIFRDLGLEPLHTELGEVTLKEPLEAAKLHELNAALQKIGFEIIDDRKSQLIERIKNLIVQEVHYSQEQRTTNLSHHLATELHHDYNYLSTLFSEITGTTIEQYYIAQKTERVKELLTYDELTVSEIAWQMGYSSVAHLSNQFKKVTGFSPSHFKSIGARKRRPLDEV